MADGSDQGEGGVRTLLQAFGVEATAASHSVVREIFSKQTVKSDHHGEERAAEEPEEPARRLNIWRGMTGQVLTHVYIKSGTTAHQVKQDIFLKTGIPIAQQQLFSFGSSDLIADDTQVDAVQQPEGCGGGLQIIVDLPACPAASQPWSECEDEEKCDEASVLYYKEQASRHATSSGAVGGLGPLARGGRRDDGRRLPPLAQQHEHPSAQGGKGGWSAGRGRGAGGKGHGGKGAPFHSGGFGAGGDWDDWADADGWERGNGWSSSSWSGGARGRGKASQSQWEAWGAAAGKMQCHLILHGRLQEPGFDILRRAKPRTKVIWQQTKACLRLHGPGSGQQEDEEDLILSVSARAGGDCSSCDFERAVELSKALIRSLGEQYRDYCRKQGWPAPEDLDDFRVETGYRRGSRKIRPGE